MCYHADFGGSRSHRVPKIGMRRGLLFGWGMPASLTAQIEFKIAVLAFDCVRTVM